jgi:hypothetical protein
MLLLTLIAAAALAGCGDDGDTVGLTEPEACKAIKERLDLKEIEGRFGKPDATQDFFGDSTVIYQRAETKWQFQVSAQSGTFRALKVKGSKEEIIACPR